MIENFDAINADGWLTDFLHESNGIVASLSGGILLGEFSWF